MMDLEFSARPPSLVYIGGPSTRPVALFLASRQGTVDVLELDRVDRVLLRGLLTMALEDLDATERTKAEANKRA